MIRHPRVRLGVSACLLGEHVRFDGGHKRDGFLTEIVGPQVEWVPLCPEVEAGFGTPREPMHLARRDGRVRLLTVATREDVTERLDRSARARADALARESLSGYVFKKDSPSCGVHRVKVYVAHGAPVKSGRGLFAAHVIDRLPHLPVEEEGRLQDPELRENFVERIFAYARVRALFDSRWTFGQLVAFHTAHKLLLMSHSPDAYQRLGRLVAHAKTYARAALRERYTGEFMAALAAIATRRRHTNVLQHMAGYFKASLDSPAKAELASAIEDYRRGLAPRDAPLALLAHHVRTARIAYLAGQIYLDPYPKALRRQ